MADAYTGSPLGSQDSEEHAGDHAGSSGAGLREQDRFLPIANVSRIMKRALPANAKIAKDAKDTVQECVSEFISFITSEASDKCQREKRKTINGDDLLWAMATLGFEDYVEPLKRYLQKFRESEGDGRITPQGRNGADATPGRDGAVQMQMMQGGYGTAAVGYPQSQGMWLNAWGTE